LSDWEGQYCTYPSFPHQWNWQPRYIWNIVVSDIKDPVPYPNAAHSSFVFNNLIGTRQGLMGGNSLFHHSSYNIVITNYIITFVLVEGNSLFICNIFIV
jgi:hypothetical protein